MTKKLGLHSARFHFVGIGGIGMCGLAELLHNIGAKVTGSDLSQNRQTEALKDLGIEVIHEHRPQNIGDVDVVVYSSAVRPDNPEILEARRRKIPVIRRAEALAEIMGLRRGIAIAGTHGKTTTTSLVASVLIAADLDPTVVVGGRLDLIKSTAVLGKGEWLVAEADESDGSFHRLSPETVVITNIDNDHMDHYKSAEILDQAFFDFAARIPFYGVVIACGDDERVRAVFKDFPKRIVYYGFSRHNDYQIEKSSNGYELIHGEQSLGEFSLPMPGKHNALNAAAALIVALEAGLDFSQCTPGLRKFQGVDRRFQLKGKAKGVDFYDDYGHHPTEIRAVLQGFREQFPQRRINVLFQPHRYSRTQLCWDDFQKCFEDADQVFVTDIYPAGENMIAGVTSEALVEKMDPEKVHYLPLKDRDLVSHLQQSLSGGDVFVTLGAGNVYKVGEALLEKMAKETL